MRLPHALVALTVTAGAVACSGDPALTGEGVIESELADQMGLGELSADCDEPENRNVGTEFACTATTEDGQVIRIVSQFDSEDEIFVYPTNVLSAADVPKAVEVAATVLSPEVGFDIDPASIECPDGPLVLAEGGVLDCTIENPTDGALFPLTITLSVFVRDEGFQNVFAQIGDAPISG